MSKHLVIRPADPRSTAVRVRRGPGLLRHIAEGPSLAAHLHHHGPPPSQELTELVARTRAVALRGKGGAAFPFATKIEATAAARGRPTVVVNLAEGEPASWKDSTLAMVAPHLVLDGAAISAAALGAREVHVVLPGDRSGVRLQLEVALAERQGLRGPRFTTTVADVAFVAGQATAVIELLSGRENRPVTTWEPAATRGLRDRPTLLSNAETFAHVALIARGNDRPTTLLTLRGDSGSPTVREVRTGTPWHKVLTDSELAGPVLLGGYHGTWAGPGQLAELDICQDSLQAAGLTLGAGIVLPVEGCPLHRAAEIATYLASESAGRCGPCVNGLPRLAGVLRDLAAGRPQAGEVERLSALVARRGACAHPDGTARMALTLVGAYASEMRLHARGRCAFDVEHRKAG